MTKLTFSNLNCCSHLTELVALDLEQMIGGQQSGQYADLIAKWITEGELYTATVGNTFVIQINGFPQPNPNVVQAIV